MVLYLKCLYPNLYKYDERNRQTHKKVPSKGIELMVYDRLDRLVFYQDARMRAQTQPPPLSQPQPQWHYTRYDAFGRDIVTQLCSISQSYATIKSTVGATQIVENIDPTTASGYSNTSIGGLTLSNNIALTFKYYDNYDLIAKAHTGLSNTTITNLITLYNTEKTNAGLASTEEVTPLPKGYQGKITAMKVKLLDRDKLVADEGIPTAVGNDNDFVFVYERYGRTIITNNYLPFGTQQTDIQVYRFDGQIQQHTNLQQINTTQQVYREKYAYTTEGILSSFSIQEGANPVQMIARYDYNEVGQLIEKNLHNTNNTCNTAADDDCFLQSVDYRYNIRSWLTQINDPNAACTPLGPQSPQRVRNCIAEQSLSFSDLSQQAEQVFAYTDDQQKALVPFERYQNKGNIGILDWLKILQGIIDQPNSPRNALPRDPQWQNNNNTTSSSTTITDTTNYAQYRQAYIQLQNILIQEAQSRCQSQQPTPQEAQQPGGPEKPDLYAQNYFYDQINTSLNNTALRNGNISATTWTTASQCQRHGFAYTYDTDNRLTNSTHKDLITGISNNFSETFAYTRNGNINSLQRRGFTDPAATNPTFGLIDNLTYTYNTQSNQIRKIEDAASSTQGFINRNIAGTGNDFEYDANGNIIRDRDKKISTSGTGLTISYNYLNLPNVMSNGGKKVVNLYDALGNKLMTRFGDDALPTAFTNTPPAHRFYLNQTQYYNAGTYPYTPAERESIYHSEGRLYYTANNGNATPTYEYTLRDHLGNLRIQFSNITDPNTGYPLILQENHYYAYGSAIPKLSTANGRERYTYNGKELVEDFNINLHNYGARQYDPLTARWNGVDALAEQYHSTTGYGYVGGNPISRIDPDGMRTWYFSEDDTYLGMTNDTHADAICIVPSTDALHVEGVINDDSYRFAFG